MRSVLATIVLAVVTLTGGVQAADEHWQFKVTPYLWAIGVDGDVGIGPVSVPVDVAFADAVQDLEMGGMVSAEAMRGSWSLMGDVAYLRLAEDTTAAMGEFELEFEQWILQGAAAYRVASGAKTRWDIGAGGRYISMGTELSTPSAGPDRSASEGWFDPVVLMRLRQQFTAKLFGVLYGDIGGFGVSSDLTWQMAAAAGYSFNEAVSMLLGYRYLAYDYEADAFSFDAAESGLGLGVQFNF
jgi:hypothetical protein